MAFIAWLAAGLLASQAPLDPSGAPETVCGSSIPRPAVLPPAGSDPVVYQIVPCFESQGGASNVDVQTYLFYIQLKPSRPSQNVWVSYTDETEQIVREDFKRLWATAFLDNLSIEAIDYPFENGVIGKVIVYRMEERQQIRMVRYVGSKALETSKIADRLKDEHLELRLNTFLDLAKVRSAEAIVKAMLVEKEFQNAEVTHEIVAVNNNPNVVQLTFHLDEGPKVHIRRIAFTGNQAMSNRSLKRQLKVNRQHSWLSFVTSRGVYQETQFDADADRLTEYYRNHGYIFAQVGQPVTKVLGESRDRKTRWIELTISVEEGARYAVGELTFEGNTVVRTDALRGFFDLRTGQYYNQEKLRKGFQKAQQAYGAGGYWEFTGYPEPRPRDPVQGQAKAVPIVDVVMKLQEGPQYLVNRITFHGNTTTHDAVVRREMALFEGGVFSTEALKYSVKRLNQLGYFKPLDEQKGVKLDKAPGVTNHLDVTFDVEEQNRNQVQFGAGLSEVDGIFGNLSYTTANLLGRGESLNLMLQKGSRGNVYRVGVSEPYMFDRPISASLDVYSQKNDYYSVSAVQPSLATLFRPNQAATSISYSEVREGATASVGRPVHRFLRGYLNYTYEIADVWISDSLLNSKDNAVAGSPLFNPELDRGWGHVDSRVAPSLVYNTVDNPIMPHSGWRMTGAVQFASQSLGGSYSYLKPDAEAVWFLPTSKRTGFGFRAEGGFLDTYGTTREVPYYLRYFLGGENQIRGVDLRTVGPLDSSRRAIGGNKFVLMNAEYYLDLFGPVRLLAYHDAGQAFEEGHPLNLREMRTSTGGELRVFVPMLNIPFRLIYFVNIYRDSFQPARGFKFAVGTTF